MLFVMRRLADGTTQTIPIETTAAPTAEALEDIEARVAEVPAKRREDDDEDGQ